MICVMVMSGDVNLKYDDGSSKLIKGNVPPPFSDDVERRIRNLVAFDEAPMLFT